MPEQYYIGLNDIPQHVSDAAQVVMDHAQKAGWSEKWIFRGLASRACLPLPLSERMVSERQPIGCRNAGQEAYDFDKKAEEVAKERGQIVVWPEPNQLQIDLDTEEEYDEFKERVTGLLDPSPFDYSTEKHFSKSGAPHRHITITFRDKQFTEWERIALQAALGSDPMREFLNTKRLFFDQTQRPTRLFETPANPPLPELEEKVEFTQDDQIF